MKLRASLSTKILVLAAGNLVLLVLAFAILAKTYYSIELKSLLFAPARDRVVAMARELAIDLEHTPSHEQTALMGRYAAVYGADFYLFNNAGPQVAGKPVTLPAEVAAELTRGGTGRGPERSGGGRRGRRGRD
ncbi:MAG TPA: hypothetical protein VNH18_00450, partial [Bryobacteraceae bacterium]|nr:hypothetical protein [Bryobacteraceae bacterium]